MERLLWMLIKNALGKLGFERKQNLNYKSKSKVNSKVGKTLRMGKMDLTKASIKELKKALGQGAAKSKMTKQKELILQIRRQLKAEQKVFKQVNTRMQRITARIVGRGLTPTKSQQEWINTYKDFFMDEWTKHRWFGVSSSAFYQMKYDKDKEMLYIVFRDSPKVYVFEGVPVWVFIYMTTLKSNACTMWWQHQFGIAYSNNPGHWVRNVKRRR